MPRSVPEISKEIFVVALAPVFTFTLLLRVFSGAATDAARAKRTAPILVGSTILVMCKPAATVEVIAVG